MTARREASISTEVTFEDGRKGTINAAGRNPRRAGRSAPPAVMGKAA